MNVKLSKHRLVLKILIIALLVSIGITSTPLAQAPGSQEDLIRDDMLMIADRYATKMWLANEWNIMHTTYLHTPDSVTNLLDPIQHPQQPANHNEGWWEPGQINIGVPYYWVGSTAIGDTDLGLYRDIEEGGHFHEKLMAQSPIVYPVG